MAQPTLSYTVKDYSQEKATMTLYIKPYSALDYDIQLTNIGVLRTNLIGTGATGISWGALQQEKQTIFNDVNSNTRPTDENFLVGRRWRVKYEDVTTKKVYRCDIPCAKTTGLLIPYTDKADLTQPEWVAFISAFEGCIQSDYGNGVAVLSARLVGRRL